MVQGVVDRMRKAREARGIAREEAAFRLGVDFSTIGRWERFATKDGPPLWAVVGYARLTGTPLVTLLGEDAPREALDAAILQMLHERLRRHDREWADFQAQFGEFFVRQEPGAQ